MQYRTLGKTDLEVSVIGMGCWAIADPSYWGSQDEHDALTAIAAAYETGVNLFDTAPLYGQGASEQLLGRAVRPFRQHILIATKVWPTELTPAELVASCEQSLRRLRCDHIDLLQVHWPNHDIPFADTYEAMDRLIEQGKVRYAGVSNFGPEDLAEALATGPIVANQLPYSLLTRSIEYAVQPMCAEHGVGILAYSPLMQGLLTGKFASLDDLPPPRTRTRHFAASRSEMSQHDESGCEAQVLAALRTIGAIAADLRVSMTALSLAWLLHRPALASILPGVRNVDQLHSNLEALEVALADDVIAALDEATEPVRQYLGTNIDPWNSGARSRCR